MRVAFGLKAHSGWAALVVVGSRRGEISIIDRRRIELVEPADIAWAKQPYHAADGMPLAQARDLIRRAVAAARRVAARELHAALQRSGDAGHEVQRCAVLTPAPMPAWTFEEILAVHIRMHQAEGVLFPAALQQAAEDNGLEVRASAEREVVTRADATRVGAIADLRKVVGSPWGSDQKLATLAALTALEI
jgi:hypothetical protein